MPKAGDSHHPRPLSEIQGDEGCHVPSHGYHLDRQTSKRAIPRREQSQKELLHPALQGAIASGAADRYLRRGLGQLLRGATRQVQKQIPMLFNLGGIGRGQKGLDPQTEGTDSQVPTRALQF